jgi:GWxTD domain-containing protein
MKKLVVLYIVLGVYFSLSAQTSAYFNVGMFNIPSQKPFIETYLTMLGSSFKFKQVKGGYQSTAHISFIVLKGDSIVKAAKYNLNGPLLTPSDTASHPSFIDNQRYALPNGDYKFELTIRDPNQPNKKPFVTKGDVTLNFHRKNLQSSSVQILEKFSKSVGSSAISKSGMDLIPYNINYFDDSQKNLAFYFETYNADTVFGTGKPFIYSYYIERNENLEKQMGLSGFKKQTATVVNPLLAQFDISKLSSGNYNVVIDVKDENNVLQFQKKWFFQRQNTLNYTAKETTEADIKAFFGDFNNVDSLKLFVECLWPISNGIERERQINQTVKKDPDLMKKYVVDFWTRRAADTANAFTLWMDYYKKVCDVQKLFKCGKQKGYFTDRGRVYLQYGAPNQRGTVPNDANTYPYEIWQYYRIKDESTGQFFTNKRFVFVNRQIADDCYLLIHSDMRGEIANEQWRFELVKRNMDGIQNGKGNTPTNSSNYQFDDMFNSPR